MTEAEFIAFTSDAIEAAIQLAEKETGLRLSRDICFRWFHQKTAPVCSGIAEHIAERVWVSPEQIFPCVDLGVENVLDDGRTLMCANVAGYEPRPFGVNWKGQPGPYVLVLGGGFANRGRQQR
jgi:hypothetical protein